MVVVHPFIIANSKCQNGNDIKNWFFFSSSCRFPYLFWWFERIIWPGMVWFGIIHSVDIIIVIRNWYAWKIRGFSFKALCSAVSSLICTGYCVCAGTDINGDITHFYFGTKLIYNNLGLVFIMRNFLKLMSTIFPSITMNILFFEFFIIALHHSRKFNLTIFNFPPSCDYPKLNQRPIIIFKSVALLPIGTLLTLKINFKTAKKNAHQHKWR